MITMFNVCVISHVYRVRECFECSVSAINLDSLLLRNYRCFCFLFFLFRFARVSLWWWSCITTPFEPAFLWLSSIFTFMHHTKLLNLTDLRWQFGWGGGWTCWVCCLKNEHKNGWNSEYMTVNVSNPAGPRDSDAVCPFYWKQLIYLSYGGK